MFVRTNRWELTDSHMPSWVAPKRRADALRPADRPVPLAVVGLVHLGFFYMFAHLGSADAIRPTGPDNALKLFEIGVAAADNEERPADPPSTADVAPAPPIPLPVAPPEMPPPIVPLDLDQMLGALPQAAVPSVPPAPSPPQMPAGGGGGYDPFAGAAVPRGWGGDMLRASASPPAAAVEAGPFDPVAIAAIRREVERRGGTLSAPARLLVRLDVDGRVVAIRFVDQIATDLSEIIRKAIIGRSLSAKGSEKIEWMPLTLES